VESEEQIEVLVQKWPVEGMRDGGGGMMTRTWVMVGGNGEESNIGENDGENNGEEVLAVFGDVEEYGDWMKGRGVSVVIEEWDLWK